MSSRSEMQPPTILRVMPLEGFRLRLELDMSNRLDTIRFCPLREPEVFQSVTTDGRRLYFGRALEITAEEAMSLAMVPPPRYVPGGEKGG